MDSFEMEKFLDYLRPQEDDLLAQMKAYASQHQVPVIRNEMKGFLETLVMMHKPKKILEIGTAIGFSSIVMCKSLEKYYGSLDGVLITTLERSDQMVARAGENIRKAGLESVITIIHEEAEKSLKELADKNESYDMIFMDAAKGQYLTFLPFCMTMLKVDGLLLSDNVLQGGDVARSRFSVERRQRTIHQRMRQYLWELNHREDLQTSIMDIADGVTVSIKLK